MAREFKSTHSALTAEFFQIRMRLALSRKGRTSEKECGVGEGTNQLWMEARGYILTFHDPGKVKCCRKKTEEVMKKKAFYCQAKASHQGQCAWLGQLKHLLSLMDAFTTVGTDAQEVLPKRLSPDARVGPRITEGMSS